MSDARPDPPPAWVRRAILQFWAVAVALWLGLELVQRLRTLLIVLLLALFLSLAMEPWVDRLERRGIRRGIGTLLTFGVLIVGTVVFFSAIGALLANQINDLVREFPDRLEGTQEWVNERFGTDIDTEALAEQFRQDGRAAQYATDLAGNLVDVGTTVIAALFQVLTVLLFTFYLTADGPRLRRVICSALPPGRQWEVLRVWELATDKTGAYLSSRLILALASSMAHWLAFTTIGLPSAVALAVWVGVLSQFVPVIGTYLAGLLPLVVAIGDEPVLALWVLGVILTYQQIENYLLLPRVTATSLAIHPAVAFAAVIIGASLLGAIGAILALPAAATVAAVAAAYVDRHEVVESRLLPRSGEPVTDPVTDPTTDPHDDDDGQPAQAPGPA